MLAADLAMPAKAGRTGAAAAGFGIVPDAGFGKADATCATLVEAAAADVATETAGAADGEAAAFAAALRCSSATSRLRAADIGFGGGGVLAVLTAPCPESATAMVRLVDGRKTMKSISTPITNGATAL